MAKKHKNLENIKIQWNGNLTNPPYGAGNKNQSIPTNVDLGKWAGEYIPCWAENYTDCVFEDMKYFEDFDVAGVNQFDLNPNGILTSSDIVVWVDRLGDNDNSVKITDLIADVIVNNADAPPKAPTSAWSGNNGYTWGDVSFVIEIADGIGTGSRRARESRLNQFEQEKKKRLIRLICRVKGEKVYDEEKEMGDTYIKLEDAELVINEVLGKMRVENANVL